MEYTGLLWKYKVDRPLTEQEIRDHLPQDKATRSVPRHQQCVIRMNSTYLECVDKYFEGVGTLTALALFCLIGPTVLLCSLVSIAYGRWETLSDSRQIQETLALLCVFAIALPFIYLGWWLIRKEAFRYTHYPIRFNRKNRMVYAYRVDGTIMQESWDKLYFTLGELVGGEKNWEVQMHRLAPDGKTVLETIGLPDYHKRDPRDSDPYITAFWEFVRRYMEEGPEAVADQVLIAMNVAGRREDLFDGYLRLGERFGPFFYTIFPFVFIEALGRSLAVWTSKIPRWPEEIERECQFPPDDPYLRDAGHLATQEQADVLAEKEEVRRGMLPPEQGWERDEDEDED